jgi:hypothetical protein
MIRWLVLAVVGACLAGSHSAYGQYTQNQMNGIYLRNSTRNFTSQQMQSRLINRTVPQYSFSQANKGIFRGTFGKPFAGASGGGSVSPWLALSEPFSSSAHNYYTQVRPQLEQQRVNQQMAARSQQMQRQLASLQSQQPYNPTGNENMAPTGHVATYMNYGGYYTPVQPTKQQR